MTNIILRPLELNLDSDASQFVALVNTIAADPITVERVRESAQFFPTDGIRQRTVAVDEHGNIIGSNEVNHRPTYVPGTFYIEVIVLPEYRRRGIGSQLYAHAVETANAHGANRLLCETQDHQPDWIRFAQSRGFQLQRHIFESTLDLQTFDEVPFAGTIESVQAQGIRFFTLADVGNTEENQRKLWEINRRDALDIPGYEGDFPRWQDFSKHVFQASWFSAAGQIFAADGEQWIGLAAVGYFKNTNSCYNMHTGVFKEYRGRKIALALKLLATRYARLLGATFIRTNNDSQNAPILAINKKMGYTPEPGWFKWVKE